MNERLTIQDLIDLLANKHSMTKKDAEAFVKEFFLLIEEALENEKYVKIKGLGTFKLIEVDNRESVNVNTGERFQIKGHTKVSFTPDTNLRDAINKPFAHFETVVLNDNAILEDTPADDFEGEEDEMAEELSLPIENLDEVKPGIVEKESPEVRELENVSEMIQEEVIAEDHIIEEEEEQIEVPAEIEPQKVECEKEEVLTEKVYQALELTAEQIIARELQNANLKPEYVEEQPEKTPVEPIINNNLKREKSPVPYLITIIVIVVLLCVGAVVFIYYPDLFSSSSQKETLDMPATAKPVQPEMQFSDTIEDKNTETIPVTSHDNSGQVQPADEKEIEATVAAPKQVSKQNQPQVSSQVYSDSAVYTITGTKGSHTIVAGESLTKVSLRYYGTKALWPYIVKHNLGVIKNPDNVPYGTTIKIPELTKK